MRLAISNMAWRPNERHAVYALLAEEGVRGLEIAPAKTFAGDLDPFAPSLTTTTRFMREIERRGLSLISMQSLLFGLADANLFGPRRQRERFENALARAVALAARLGIPNLVLGSPANRVIPDIMSRAEAEQIAIESFRRIGDLCLKARTKLALEPNSACYGTNFLNTTNETLSFVRRVAHPAVSTNFDIGSALINAEMDDIGDYFAEAGHLVSHIHVSEPNLAPAPRDEAQFEALARAMLAHGYRGWFSIEMREVPNDNLTVIRAAVAACSRALAAADQKSSTN